jgi:predicted nucleic acid-binding protein
VTVSFDTNVLVYAIGQASTRRRRAREILYRAYRIGKQALLLQSLEEMSYVGLRKLRMPDPMIRYRVRSLCRMFDIHPSLEEDLIPALDAVRDHKLAFWDALLWATARRVGVRTLFSEDLQDGRMLDGVRFVNPFDPRNDALVDKALPP